MSESSSPEFDYFSGFRKPRFLSRSAGPPPRTPRQDRRFADSAEIGGSPCVA